MGLSPPVKWVIVVILVILVAPTIAKRLESLDPDKRDEAGTPQQPTRRRGIVYRTVARFGPRRTFMAFVLVLLILAVAVYLLIQTI